MYAKRKVPRSIKRAVKDYQDGMEKARKSMEKMMKGGYLNRMYMGGGHMNPAASLFHQDPGVESYMESPIQAVPQQRQIVGWPIHQTGGTIDRSAMRPDPMSPTGIFYRDAMRNSYNGNYMNVYGAKHKQEGGMMDEQQDAMQPSPSQMHMASLAQGQTGPSEQEYAMQQQQAQQQQMQQQLMALAQAIAQGNPQAIEQLKQLPPEIQAQVVQMVEQMKQGGQQMYNEGQGQPQQQRMGGNVKKRKMKRSGQNYLKVGGYKIPC